MYPQESKIKIKKERDSASLEAGKAFIKKSSPFVCDWETDTENGRGWPKATQRRSRRAGGWGAEGSVSTVGSRQFLIVWVVSRWFPHADGNWQGLPGPRGEGPSSPQPLLGWLPPPSSPVALAGGFPCSSQVSSRVPKRSIPASRSGIYYRARPGTIVGYLQSDNWKEKSEDQRKLHPLVDEKRGTPSLDRAGHVS